MKRKALALTFILALLLLAVVGTYSVRPTNANFVPAPETPPPAGTKPPTISIVSPEDKVYASKEILLTFNVGSATCPIRTSSLSLATVYYKVDWMQNETYVDDGFGSYAISLTNVPDGVHNVSVRAEQGCYYSIGYDNYYFRIETQSSVGFAVDNTAPFISILLENNSYVSADVQLTLVVNESVSLSYILDGGGNLPIEGNVTLTGLSDGEHNVTVYAMDAYGNTASETIYFTVASASFAAVTVAASSAVIVAAIAGLLVYFRKRKQDVRS